MEKQNRENWTVSRTPIETSSTSDLWLVTRIIYPVIVAGTTSRHSLRLTREKHINGDWSSPPCLEKIFWFRIWFHENKEKARGALDHSVLMQSKYRTSRGIEYRENARSAPMASIEIYELSREGQTHVEISFNSIIGCFNLHIGSTS